MLKRNEWTRGRIALREWLPVIVLMCCTFVFNTSEFIPIGLLSDIAADFGITEARAGLLITVYAWVVALVSLPLMLAVARMECRRLMLGVLGLFIASHVLSGLSSSYAMLMASRIGVACAHAVFWSIVSPLAVRVAPKGAQSAALGLIITGTSIAMIVGLPLGRVIGLYVGWRTTFFFIAAVAAAVWLFLAAIFPRVPSRDTISLRKVPSLLGNPALVGLYVLTVLMVTGHYTGYSYIEPFLAQVAGLDNDWITWVLTAFGLVGIVGSLWFSRDYENVPTPSCGLPSWVLRFSCCCCAFRLSGTFRLSLCVSAGGWPLRFSTWFFSRRSFVWLPRRRRSPCPSIRGFTTSESVPGHS